MAQQVYTWPEGQAAIWTGAGSTSALFAYCQNTQVALTYGWVTRQVGDGSYHSYITGQQAQITVAAAYTYSMALWKIAEAHTAIHIKFIHSGIHGTAGYTFYSGQLQTLSYAGTEAAPFTYNLAANFNLWTGFGGS